MDQGKKKNPDYQSKSGGFNKEPTTNITVYAFGGIAATRQKRGTNSKLTTRTSKSGDDRVGKHVKGGE